MKHSDKVDGRPAIQFYHRDAINDVGLRMSSLSARGQWYEMLWLMYDSPERGVLLKPNGKQISEQELSRILSAPLAEIVKNLSELKTNGVYSIRDDAKQKPSRSQAEAQKNAIESEADAKQKDGTATSKPGAEGKQKSSESKANGVYSTRGDGAIYNRRMVRDEKQRQSKVEAERKIRQSKVEAGRKGGLSRGASKTKQNDPPSSSSSSSASPLGPPDALEKNPREETANASREDCKILLRTAHTDYDNLDPELQERILKKRMGEHYIPLEKDESVRVSETKEDANEKP